MKETIDELGPVDWIVVEFPGSELRRGARPHPQEYVDQALIRVLDLLFLTKDDDGRLEAVRGLRPR